MIERTGTLLEGFEANPSARLFALCEYDQAFEGFLTAAIRALMRSNDPILQKVRHEVVEHLPSQRITVASGDMVESCPIDVRMDFMFKDADVVAGDVAALTVALDKAAEQGVSTLMPGVFDYLSKICEATGNVVDAAGRPLTHELILSALEKVEIDFDENDEPIMPTLVVHPAFTVPSARACSSIRARRSSARRNDVGRVTCHSLHYTKYDVAQPVYAVAPAGSGDSPK